MRRGAPGTVKAQGEDSFGIHSAWAQACLGNVTINHGAVFPLTLVLVHRH